MDLVALPLALPPALPATDALQCPHGAWNAPGAKGTIQMGCDETWIFLPGISYELCTATCSNHQKVRTVCILWMLQSIFMNVWSCLLDFLGFSTFFFFFGWHYLSKINSSCGGCGSKCDATHLSLFVRTLGSPTLLASSMTFAYTPGDANNKIDTWFK